MPKIPDIYMNELQKLINFLLHKDPSKRPNINQVLTHPMVKEMIPEVLSQDDFEAEFNHTVLHNRDFLKEAKEKRDQAKITGEPVTKNLREDYKPGIK